MILKRTHESLKSKNSEASYIELKNNLIILVINGRKEDSVDPVELLCVYQVYYTHGFLIDDLEDPFYILEFPGRYWVVPRTYLDAKKLVQYCFPDGKVRGKFASLLSFPWVWREKVPFFGRLFPVPCLGIHRRPLKAKWELTATSL